MYSGNAPPVRHRCRTAVKDGMRWSPSSYFDLLPREHSTTYEFTNRFLSREARSQV
jgi:hypothetical protein